MWVCNGLMDNIVSHGAMREGERGLLQRTKSKVVSVGGGKRNLGRRGVIMSLDTNSALSDCCDTYALFVCVCCVRGFSFCYCQLSYLSLGLCLASGREGEGVQDMSE